MHFLGLERMPRRYYTYSDGSGWSGWNLVSTLGAYLLGASVLVFLAAVYRSLKSGQPAGPDPWDGATLEWSIPSPPPVYNFATIPVVRHRDPLWEEKYGQYEGEGHAEEEKVEATIAGIKIGEAKAPDEDPREQAERRAEAGDPHNIHLPNPSFWPLVTSFGLFLGAMGLLVDNPHISVGALGLPVLTAAGLLTLIAGVYGWSLEPAS